MLTFLKEIICIFATTFKENLPNIDLQRIPKNIENFSL